eukprot:999753-Prymnesium_polylepis.1
MLASPCTEVSKFVGTPYKKGTGVEALLDIEFMMGVSPGVKTQFWEWPEMDFCGDLHKCTVAASNSAQPSGIIVHEARRRA